CPLKMVGTIVAIQSFGRQWVQGGRLLYTSHSLRRGFATWATANGWDIKALMTYVGWKDIKSAMRYIDPAISFGGLAARPALELNASTLTQVPASH
uniref:tyrosine-type recombinase/integrase n=1 Tax=Pseudomonas aeruginosa TaxID=287 RepID=UPI0026EDB602